MNSTTDDFNLDLFHQVSSITISLVAIIGNSLIFYIFAKPEFKTQSFFRYLFFGTIFNTINALLIWPINYPDFFLINEILISCNLQQYINMCQPHSLDG